METACSVPAAERGPLFLLDGNNIAYRAFFALPPEIATSAGFPTNALYGFCAMVIKILAEYHPGAVIVAWDSQEKTFRHGEFEDYKAQRKPMPDLLSQQWPYLAGAVCGLRVRQPGGAGLRGRRHPGHARPAGRGRRAGDALIVTGDRDALQLAGRHVSDHGEHPRGHRGQDLRPGGGGGALRGAAPAHPRPDRAQGRHLRQHPRHPRHRGEDGRPTAAAVRRPGRGARAHRQGVGPQAPGTAAARTGRSRCSRGSWPASTATRPSTSTRPRCCRISSSATSWRSCSPGSSSTRCSSGSEPLLPVPAAPADDRPCGAALPAAQAVARRRRDAGGRRLWTRRCPWGLAAAGEHASGWRKVRRGGSRRWPS